jgi:hypothetical protein
MKHGRYESMIGPGNTIPLGDIAREIAPTAGSSVRTFWLIIQTPRWDSLNIESSRFLFPCSTRLFPSRTGSQRADEPGRHTETPDPGISLGPNVGSSACCRYPLNPRIQEVSEGHKVSTCSQKFRMLSKISARTPKRYLLSAFSLPTFFDYYSPSRSTA